MKNRFIFHCDCNNFFVSCETAGKPEYHDLPVAVAGDPKQRHGIILAKNYPAKRAGVQTAETINDALRKCPDLILLPPHMHLYEEFSRRANAVYRRYTNLIEPFSIDESWLDVSSSCASFAQAEDLADQIRNAIRTELGITISVGVANNKIYAKLGSDYKKPDVTTVFDETAYERIIRFLSVGDLFGIGDRMRAHLDTYGIKTIGQLGDADEYFLQKKFGIIGPQLRRNALGLDVSPVQPFSDPVKSLGNGQTYPHDVLGESEVRSCILDLSEKLGTRLRASSLQASTVSVTIRGTTLKDLRRQTKPETPMTNARQIADAAYRLACENWDVLFCPIRAITVTVSGLKQANEGQVPLFLAEEDETIRKNSDLESTMDFLRDKYGKTIIHYGLKDSVRKRKEPKHDSSTDADDSQ